MRVFTAAAAATLVVLLSVPAQAQFSMGGSGDSTKTRYTEQEKRNEAANEKAYKDTLKNTRGANNDTFDPWRNIRQPDPPTGNKPQR